MAIIDVVLKKEREVNGQKLTGNAKGEYNTVTRRVTIKAGSKVCAEYYVGELSSNALKAIVVQKAIGKLNLLSPSLIVPNDVGDFSVTCSANAVLARNSDGYNEWRVEGKEMRLGEYLRQQHQ